MTIFWYIPFISFILSFCISYLIANYMGYKRDKRLQKLVQLEKRISFLEELTEDMAFKKLLQKRWANNLKNYSEKEDSDGK